MFLLSRSLRACIAEPFSNTPALCSQPVSSRSALAAQPSGVPSSTPIKTVRTPILEIGYHESGPAGGVPVILLHGFPDDAHAYDGVAPMLAKAGHRALSVYLRGYGPTRFLDARAPKTAEQAAIGQDVIDFADALNLRDSSSLASIGAAAPPASLRPFIPTAFVPRC